jgi:hypothetical protein
MSQFRKALLQRIQDKGGLGVIYERVAAGEYMYKISADYDCSPQFLRRLLTKTEDRATLYHTAVRDAAQAHAEKAGAILDEVDVKSPFGREEMTKAKERAAHRRWMASKLDKETFGDSPLVQVSAPQTFSALFLEAARTRALPVPSGADVLPVQEAQLLPAGESKNG